MGLLSFLSRKPSQSPTNPSILKAQAYDATVPSLPPVLGTFPVPGNGQKILENFQKSHPNLREGCLHDLSAPPPLVPRLRSESVDRPNTASSILSFDVQGPLRSESVPPEKPKVQLRPPPKKRHGPYRLPPKDSVQHHAVATPTPPYKALSPAFAQERSSSMRSDNSASNRAFVDLLDAHSFIKPSDFYSRVKAAGARNYGEDVADRNMGESGSGISSESAREFHGKNVGVSSLSRVQRAMDDVSEDEPLRRPRKRHSMGSGIRTKSLNSGMHDAYPGRASSRGPYDPLLPMQTPKPSPKFESKATEKAEKAARRRSLPSYISASSSTDRPRASSRSRRVKEVDANYFPDSLRDRARAAAYEDSLRSLTIRPSSSRKQTGQPEKPRDSVLYAKGTIEKQSRHTRNDSEQTIPDRDVRIKSSKHSSRRRTISHVPSSGPPKSPSKRHSMYNSYVSNYSEAQHDLPRQRKSRQRSSSLRKLESVTDLRDSFFALPSLLPVPRSELISHRSRPVSRDQPNYHIRNRSLVSLPNRSILPFDIEESIPERTSSIRHWSLTSETADSNQSSDPFRPQSGHTTSTSVDLMPVLPTSKPMNAGQPPFCPASPHFLPERRQQSAFADATSSSAPPRSVAEAPRDQPSAMFNIDDYISSDDEDISPMRPRGEDEKDLLFADECFGFPGSRFPGLPGLLDDAVPQFIPSATPPKTASRVYQTSFHLEAFGSGPDDVRRPRTAPHYSTRPTTRESQGRSLRFQAPISSYTDSENGDDSEREYESEEELSFDIPFTRAETGRRQTLGNHRWRYEAAEQSIKEEQDPALLDIATLVRLRKEAKAKQRAAGVTFRRNKDKGKGKGKEKAPDVRTPKIVIDDPSGYADEES